MLIQIVEDDRALREGIALALKEPDMVFLQSGSVEAAKKDFEREMPGLIILDVNLPDGSGYDYLKWVRARSYIPALGNVLDNAVKYSPPGSTVGVSVEEYELYAAVSVKDQGIGIREEDAARIFRRFYRAEGLRQEEGSGIGLYLTREILRRENGYIKVKSREDEGAEFTLFLQK